MLRTLTVNFIVWKVHLKNSIFHVFSSIFSFEEKSFILDEILVFLKILWTEFQRKQRKKL